MEKAPNRWPLYLFALQLVFGLTLLNAGLAIFLAPVNLIMIYLAGVMIIAWRAGRGPSILASVLSVVVFDFFFVNPRLSFAVSDYQYLLTFGVMLAVGLVISDLTNRVKKQAEAGQLARTQIETERLKNTILSSIPHDLRTPLAAITGSASSLLQGGEQLDAATRQDLIRNILTESQQLTELFNNLLDLTRLESGAFSLHLEMLAFDEVVGAALSRLEKRLEGREVNTQVDPRLTMLKMDGQLMEQVVVNLIDNAIKYTPANTPIDIRLIRKSGYVVMEIADQGTGLPAGSEERIFEKFYRADQLGREGFGLGLAICRSIVSLHQGSIAAENRPEGGAIFRISLPIIDFPAREQPQNG